MSLRDVFRLTGNAVSVADAVVEKLDELSGRLAQLEHEVLQHTEDLGAILEKMDSEATSRQSDCAHLRGRVEGCEREVSSMIPAINDMLLTVLKATKKVRR